MLRRIARAAGLAAVILALAGARGCNPESPQAPPNLVATQAQLEVQSNPPAARIELDGAPSGVLTPHTFQVSPGLHSVSVAMDGVTFAPGNCASDLAAGQHSLCSFAGSRPVDSCTITITAPRRDASLEPGKGFTITWRVSGTAGPVRIELLRNGVSRCVIASNATNTGSYRWVVNDCSGGSGDGYQIRITSTDTDCEAVSPTFKMKGD